jgi:hypothetical protein
MAGFGENLTPAECSFMAANLPSGHYYRPIRKRLTFPAYFRQLPQNSHGFSAVIPLAPQE